MKVYDYNQEFGGNYYQVSPVSPAYILEPGLTSGVISAHDPVHQQEGHLRPVHEAPGRVPAAQRRGHLRQVHQHALPGDSHFTVL